MCVRPIVSLKAMGPYNGVVCMDGSLRCLLRKLNASPHVCGDGDEDDDKGKVCPWL